MLKSYTTSKVSFNTQIVKTLDKPKSREETRKEQGKRTSIKAVDGGIGYQVIESNNQII